VPLARDPRSDARLVIAGGGYYHLAW